MRDYEFVIYDAEARQVDHQFLEFEETVQARTRAARFAKASDGPVDLAFATPGKEWADRYITTAAPSEFHKTGVRFEKIA